MNAEWIAELQRRAAKHAALSDPTRLSIVDLLLFGDQTPSELRHVLELPSNLVAHHLKVLEAEGMVIRTRSEADQRRNYVHLVRATLDGIHVGRPRAVSRVVFVCTANSARSQLAAALWSQASTIPTASAGTHPAAHIAPGAIDTADRHGMTLTAASPRQLDDVIAAHDFVITVCDNAHEELDSVGDLHWSVPDPVRAGSVDAFDAAFDELSKRVTDLAPLLTPLNRIG
ncbi:arsenate reductase/protein-tyrosine-phosphatase family protein [Lacisediminihabitans changchengi]|uniref:Helix-turn-helix domain-containing protein n=1 Tax=Lacisediminihabitans changchengi TaxID=2787634 RepID=A0A934SKF4_9MICO|nr:ArsR family transcriptional regulator [Lacisediminihabitans changchengi]MBK4348261.1 helix-turn-helix domain-containing protein [Lacisediminihabitans changchengi]